VPALPARLARTTDDERVVWGVAGGIARALGVDPVLVRIAFAVLGLASGVGVIAYVVAAVVLPEADEVEPAGEGRGAADAEQALGIGMVTLGVLLLARRLGATLPDPVLWPVVLVAIGAGVSWSRAGGRPVDLLDGGRTVVARLVVGALLLAGGIGWFVARGERLAVAAQLLLAVLVTTGGIVLLAGPWIVGLGRQLAEERAARIRAAERADVAAHLHDSVLQTLALIQRRADSPTDTIALARRQERELRDWLYGAGSQPVDPGATLGAALRSVVDEVEADHAVTVDVVVVGEDVPLGEQAAALVSATREAIVNAAKHAGAPTVSVYAEADDRALTAFVRDRGRGFDPAAVPPDRRGLADSVVGRLQRHGGEAHVRSAPGEGTEVELRVPRREVAS